MFDALEEATSAPGHPLEDHEGLCAALVALRFWDDDRRTRAGIVGRHARRLEPATDSSSGPRRAVCDDRWCGCGT